MGGSLAVVMEPLSGKEVSPVGVVAIGIVDAFSEGGSVPVEIVILAEVCDIEPNNSIDYSTLAYTCAQNSHRK